MYKKSVEKCTILYRDKVKQSFIKIIDEIQKYIRTSQIRYTHRTDGVTNYSDEILSD